MTAQSICRKARQATDIYLIFCAMNLTWQLQGGKIGEEKTHQKLRYEFQHNFLGSDIGTQSKIQISNLRNCIVLHVISIGIIPFG